MNYRAVILCALVLLPLSSGAAVARATLQGAGDAPKFEVESTPDQNLVRVRVRGQEVLRLTNKYLLRLRCDPGKDMWLGYDNAEINLGWFPNASPAVAVTAVDAATDGDRLRVVVAGEKPGYPGARFETTLTGEFDDRGLIRYTLGSDFRQGGAATAGPARGGFGRVEFLDVWIDRIFWPEKYRGSRELYEQFVFGTPHGVLRAPKLHVFTVTPDPASTFETLIQDVEQGSFFGVVDKAEGGFRFGFDRLSAPGSVAICWWTWDPHFLIENNPAETLSYTVTIDALDAEQGRDLLGRAKPIRFRADPDYQLPTFRLEGVNDFSGRVSRPADWAWERTSDRARLDMSVGYEDSASATIRGESGERHAWYSRILWQDVWTQYPIRGRYRLSAKVRTRGATGQARIGIVQDDGPESLLYGEASPSFSYSQPVKGDAEWVDCSLDFTASATRVKVFLEHEGPGQAWFDDVRLVPLCDPAEGGPAAVAFHARDHGGAAMRRFESWKMTSSRPEVRSPLGLIFAWPESWASTPAVTLRPGDYQLVVHARGEGCMADQPVLLVEGPPGLARSVAVRPDANDDYVVAFSLRKRQEVSFRLAFVNDGPCAESGQQKDKNVFIRALTLAGPLARP
jgi:hypothetical protein